jgi:hypothetical protein
MAEQGDIIVALIGVLRTSDSPLMATEIASELRDSGHENADKKVVNHLLYGPLKGQVRQDASYRWTLAERSASVKEASPAAGQPQAAGRTPTWSRFGHYVDYYKECIAEDEHPESSYPLFKLTRDVLCHPLREEWCSTSILAVRELVFSHFVSFRVPAVALAVAGVFGG